MYRIGIDLGGTNIAVGIVDDEYRILGEAQAPTPVRDGAGAVMGQIARCTAEACAAAGIALSDCAGAGLGAPGTCDTARGFVRNAHNLGWDGVSVTQPLHAALGCPVFLGNDADCAALGEVVAGAAKGCDSALLITLGTGIGGGFVLNGKILNGAHGVAGEIGHLTINRDEQEFCTCGRRGCAEQYASARSVARIARKRLAKDERPSLLKSIPFLTAKDVFECASQGDSLATEILEDTYTVLGETIADACCMIDPELVVVGGGMSKAGQVLLDGIEPKFKKFMFHACKDTKFALATLGNDAGIYGGFRLIAGKTE